MTTPNDQTPFSQTSPAHEPGVPTPPGRDADPLTGEALPSEPDAIDPHDPLVSEPLGEPIPNDPISPIVPRRGDTEPIRDPAHTVEQRPVEPAPVTNTPDVPEQS